MATSLYWVANKQLTDAVEQLSNGIRGQVLIEKGSEVEIQLSQTIINISTYFNKTKLAHLKVPLLSLPSGSYKIIYETNVQMFRIL